MKTIIASLLLVVTLASQIPGRELAQRPWMPAGASISTGSVGFTAGRRVIGGSDIVVPLLHRGDASRPYIMNPFKGALGESLMDDFFTRGFLERSGGWVAGTPSRIGPRGIDGLYFKSDAAGHIKDLFVAEAKYGASRLGLTKDGVQMGGPWTSKRLSGTAANYERMANRMQMTNAAKASRRPAVLPSNSLKVPMSGDEYAYVWDTRDGTRFFAKDPRFSPADVQQQLRRTADYLNRAASGQASYRPRLFHYAAVGREHRITIAKVDSVTAGAVDSQTFQGRFDELPKQVQTSLRRMFRRTFVEMGKSPREIRELTKRCCDDPQFFSKMHPTARWSALAGIDRRAVVTGFAGGAIAGGIDVFVQWQESGEIDLVRTGTVTGLGLGAGFAGHYTGVQTATLLGNTTIGRNILAATSISPGAYGGMTAAFGSFAGGVAASAVFSYGMYFAGYTDLRTANRSMIASAAGTAAGAGFTYGTLTLVSTYGVASTGTAISTLSGAAAANATWAYLGGGSLAAGGFGMTGGMIVVTGGAAVVVVAVAATVTYCFYLADKAEQRRLITGKIALCTRRVMAGDQPEWRRG